MSLVKKKIKTIAIYELVNLLISKLRKIHIVDQGRKYK